MAKEREQVQQQIRVGMYQHLVKPVNITLKELILVLLDDGAKPMGIIMQENTRDCQASQGIALRPRQQLLFHSFLPF